VVLKKDSQPALLFQKWNATEVDVSDLSLQDYISKKGYQLLSVEICQQHRG